MAPRQTHYEVLGVPSDADYATFIKRRYRALAKEVRCFLCVCCCRTGGATCDDNRQTDKLTKSSFPRTSFSHLLLLRTKKNHPDKFQDEAEKKEATVRMQRINEANEILKDAQLRREYDRSLVQIAFAPPPVPSAPKYTKLRADCVVQIRNLASREELNGVHVYVCGFDPITGRCVVRLFGEYISIRPENLEHSLLRVNLSSFPFPVEVLFDYDPDQNVYVTLDDCALRPREILLPPSTLVVETLGGNLSNRGPMGIIVEVGRISQTYLVQFFEYGPPVELRLEDVRASLPLCECIFEDPDETDSNEMDWEPTL